MRAEGPSRTPQVPDFIGNIFKFRFSEMQFPGLWGRFDTILMVTKQCYSIPVYSPPDPPPPICYGPDETNRSEYIGNA
jgi:hypothetical protein